MAKTKTNLSATAVFRKFLVVLLLVGFAACAKTSVISKDEKEWLKNHPNLIVGISPNAPPYQFVNEKGEVAGIFIDFLSIIESRLNYKFKKVYESDFSKLLLGTKEGYVDALLEVQKTDERQHYLRFTPPLVSHAHVIVVRNSQKGILSVEDLKGKMVAVVSNYAIEEYLTKAYPYIKLIPQDDDVSCLRTVSTGQVDAFVCQQGVATYYIEMEGISNLKIAGAVNYKNELSIASRKELDTLNTILSKVVNTITKNEKFTIYNRWLSQAVKPFYMEAKFWIITVIGIVFVLFLAILFNLALQRSVKQKTRELEIAKEKAEESDRLKTAFLANMSHEIRTPMNGILGFADLLKNPNLTGQKQQEYIAVIEKGGVRLLNIINDLIDISVIATGQLDVTVSESNINEQIEFICGFFEPEIKRKGMTIAFTNSLPFEDAIVYTDTEKLYSILTNLVKNAIKYSEQGTIELGYEKRGDYFELYVKDSGIGIPEDRQEAIFGRFVQGDISDIQARQGAGLGLAITKAYVELLGGKIWLNSSVGVGSCFYFTIPCKFEPSKEILNVNDI